MCAAAGNCVRIYIRFVDSFLSRISGGRSFRPLSYSCSPFLLIHVFLVMMGS